MRLHIMSDLHTEYRDFPYEAPPGGADVLVVAGDVGLGCKGLEWIRASCPRTLPVVYVIGNHEYWGQDVQMFPEQLQDMASSIGPNIRVLERNAVEIEGVVFMGATLWSDFSLCDTEEESMRVAQERCPDFMLIQSGNEIFAPKEAKVIHNLTIEWIRATCREQPHARRVVVTHYPPLRRLLRPELMESKLSPAYASERADVVAESSALLWVCGHTYLSFDEMVGRTRVVSNPAGGSGAASIRNFNPHLVIDV